MAGARKIVIKVGSNILVDKGGLRKRVLIELARVVSELRSKGHSVAIVTSGAGAMGRVHLGLSSSPKDMISKQALCAVGQVLLMHAYLEAFEFYGLRVAQLLLTRDDFAERSRFLNLRNTLIGLEKRGIVPVVNENDTVAVEEIRFGDNDTLSAMFAIAWDADVLILLTSVDGVIGADGRVIEEYSEGAELAKIEKTSFGAGGIDTKISAALMASESGVDVYIANGNELGNVFKIVDGENPGTRFRPSGTSLTLKKSWLKYLSQPKGRIYVDAGTSSALHSRKSLLPVGIVSVEGTFERGDVVEVVHGAELLGRGISNYSSTEVAQIKGKRSSELPEELFPYEEVVHADNFIPAKELR
ncbi:glutamate 5-kinase [Fervidobacterium thailandense]|uniref:Glutamate 5-kinase n=1 Tax=Fervidobacterium thailandense TaxID=1008305 RepID=A0A1E3G399_9BACT|nr:glutamate 5-kinase [Fervidobacterium thailandense]ODN30640.1 glutamate 5-kinase [Fervidobacterium thailandense]